MASTGTIALIGFVQPFIFAAWRWMKRKLFVHDWYKQGRKARRVLREGARFLDSLRAWGKS